MKLEKLLLHENHTHTQRQQSRLSMTSKKPSNHEMKLKLPLHRQQYQLPQIKLLITSKNKNVKVCKIQSLTLRWNIFDISLQVQI